jgi:hypothetical protein
MGRGPATSVYVVRGGAISKLLYLFRFVVLDIPPHLLTCPSPIDQMPDER